jgi:hypothetical protein
MFNEDFKHGSAQFTVNTDGFEWVNLSDIIKTKGHSVLKVQKVFIVTPTKGKSKGKEKPVLVADNVIIWLPEHCLDDVKKILSNDEYIIAINNGKCGFQTTEYEDTKYDNGTCFSGHFVDI